MNARNVCSNCMWSKQSAMPHCVSVRNQGDRSCSRFQPYKEVDVYRCGQCDRDKDPGKCWWCGEIDA